MFLERLKILKFACFKKIASQKTSLVGLTLVAVISCSSVVEAVHSDEIDCEEQNCLVCHANTDEYQGSASHPLFLAVALADLIFSAGDRLVDKELKANLSIRGPPRYLKGEYV